MRPIKFRAWDKEKGRMSLPVALFSPVISWTDGDVQMPVDFALLKERCEWMQFTGLLDKNGKEIYEGDVVELDGDRFTVQWDCFGWALFWMMCNERWLSDAGQYTVIGNVYEGQCTCGLDKLLNRRET